MQIFLEEKLKVTMDPSTKIVEFLDVVMDLSTGTHKPFNKPNKICLYDVQPST